MELLKTIRRSRLSGLMVLLLGALVVGLLLPAYGQQEVDPTWYDPWGPPHPVVVHASRPRATVHQRVVKSVASSKASPKARGKRLATRQRPS